MIFEQVNVVNQILVVILGGIAYCQVGLSIANVAQVHCVTLVKSSPMQA